MNSQNTPLKCNGYAADESASDNCYAADERTSDKG